MSLPARDDINRLEAAQQRLAAALNRLESALARPVASAPIPIQEMTSEELEKLSALEAEVTALRDTKTLLEQANSSALAKVDATISRLKSVMEA